MTISRRKCIIGALITLSILNISCLNKTEIQTFVATYLISRFKHNTSAINSSVKYDEAIHEENIQAPSFEREIARCSVEQDTTVCSNNMQSQMLKLKQLAHIETVSAKIDEIIDYRRETEGVLRNDISDLSKYVDRLSEWRYKESLNLEALVQTRLERMQGGDMILVDGKRCSNPLVERVTVHMLGPEGYLYWENDDIVDVTTEIKRNLHPRAIPDDIADSVIRFHRNPPLWWMGQLIKYVLRSREHLDIFIEDKQRKLNFTHPVVGVHVRRTDKLIHEAKYHGIDEYMRHVVDWYDAYEQRHPGVKRRVYIATDDPSCVTEAKEKYPTYTFINDNEVSQSASPKHRYSSTSLLGFMADIHFLSNSDYFVCTLSSSLARPIYELMQTKHGDASNLVASVDVNY